MVIADRKPIQEILEMVAPYGKILLVGCKGCVTVCCTGGEKEVGVLASTLRIARRKDGKPIEVVEHVLERQCDPEYISQLAPMLAGGGIEAILSIACAVGPQFLATQYNLPIFPGLNNQSIGGAREHGVWAEFCQACGNCVTHHFGGICPITRCSKSLFNGPCGGSAKGVCEVNKDIPCAWQQIYDRMVAVGRLDELRRVFPAKDWSTARDGGPRKLVREDLRI